jgi:hypothetical protein
MFLNRFFGIPKEIDEKENLLNKINNFMRNKFPEINLFQSTFEGDLKPVYHYTLPCTLNSIDIKIYISINLKKKEMSIDCLSKCENIKGTDMLNMLIELAKYLNLDKIVLVDESKFKYKDCDIDLSTLDILVTGQSWYNKYGFYSYFYDKEKIHNNNFIKNNFDEKLISYKDFILKCFNIHTTNKTIQQVFKEIKNLFLTNAVSLTAEQCSNIKNMFSDILYKLEYFDSLTKDLKKNGGKNKKRSKKKKTNKKYTRKQRENLRKKK